jgi:hypothetical protein
MPTAIELLERECSRLLEALEDMARQHCCTERADHPEYPLRTDSGALSANAEALEILHEHKRFRCTISCGRMVLGYWPENEPEPRTDAGGGGLTCHTRKR